MKGTLYILTGGLNCAAFAGGVVQAFLTATQFVSVNFQNYCHDDVCQLQPAKVQTFWHKQHKTAIRIQFEDYVIAREKNLESR